MQDFGLNVPQNQTKIEDSSLENFSFPILVEPSVVNRHD